MVYASHIPLLHSTLYHLGKLIIHLETASLCIREIYIHPIHTCIQIDINMILFGNDSPSIHQVYIYLVYAWYQELLGYPRYIS
jgi:hypothetical protein